MTYWNVKVTFQHDINWKGQEIVTQKQRKLETVLLWKYLHEYVDSEKYTNTYIPILFRDLIPGEKTRQIWVKDPLERDKAPKFMVCYCWGFIHKSDTKDGT